MQPRQPLAQQRARRNVASSSSSSPNISARQQSQSQIPASTPQAAADQPQPQRAQQQPAAAKTKTTQPKQQQDEDKSTVKTYRPPDDSSPPVLCIHTKPTLMRKLLEFLQHFDKPPQQLFLEFAFVEVNEDDVAQFRYKLNHPLLQTIYDGATSAASAAAAATGALPADDLMYRTAQQRRQLDALGGVGLDEDNPYPFVPSAMYGAAASEGYQRSSRPLRNLPSELSPRL